MLAATQDIHLVLPFMHLPGKRAGDNKKGAVPKVFA
jgi:hypothetical protein